MEPKYSGFEPDADDVKAKTAAPAEPDHVVHSLLEFLEDLLIRMIKGVVRFTLIRIPIKILQYLNRYFPTLIRLFRVLFYFVIWLLLLVAPIALILWYGDPWLSTSLNNAAAMRQHFRTADPLEALWFAFNSRSWASIFSMAWLVVWAGGSVWGLLFTVRRARRERRRRRAERAAVPAELNPLPQGRGRR